VKGNVLSIIHAPLVEDSYHRIEDFLICPAEGARHSLRKPEDLIRRKRERNDSRGPRPSRLFQSLGSNQGHEVLDAELPS